MSDKQRPRWITMSEIMTPNMANFTGSVHGGFVLSFFDKVAYACGSQYAGLPVVTLSVDQVFFKEPIHVGDLLTCHASVNFVGTTSMEVGMRAEATDLFSGKKRHTNTCYFTMVAIDKNGKPTPITPLSINNETEKRRYEEAKDRRKFRLEHFQNQYQKK